MLSFLPLTQHGMLMASKSFDTLIIGAGISGLACAKHLSAVGEDFLLISKDIGGRMLTSEDGTVNYGAFFVCSDYYHVLPHVNIKSRIKLSDFCFHNQEQSYVLFEPTLIPYTFQFLKTIKMLYRFRKAFRLFRKKSENISQKQAIEQDSLLHDLYMKNADEFVQEHHLQKGTDKYLSKALYSTTFSTISEMNAFSFLQFLLPLITPIYTFTFEKEKMTEPFKERIVLGDVTDVHYKNKHYKVQTKDTFFQAKNLVIATDISSAIRFASLKKTNKPVRTHMVHLAGKPIQNIARRKYQLFTPPSNVQAIANLGDGTYLSYYKHAPPSVESYFTEPRVIGRHFWDPAGTINGHTLIESNRGNNLYVTGDGNVAGLEESYITGLYAANHICSCTK